MKFKTGEDRITKIKTTNYLSLPQQLVEDIKSLGLSKTYQSAAFKFVGILLRDSFREYADLSSFTPKPQLFLQKTFGERNYPWLKALLEKFIISRSEFYSKDSSVCYGYAVPSSYFASQGNIVVEYKDVVQKKLSSHFLSKAFATDMEKLTIDFGELRRVMEEKIGKLTIDDFKVDEQIKETVIKFQSEKGEEFFVSAETAKKKAIERGQSLIQSKNKYVIADKDEFINSKKNALRVTYLQSIDELERGQFRANRNATNNRLDTNLTNLCSDLVESICEQNGLTQIDLSNSQFAILSNILNGKLDTDDFRLFKELSVSGKLYVRVADIFGFTGTERERKKQGKNAMFQIMFSSRKNNSNNKSIIKGAFPSVINWIDDFKKLNGDNAFAVMLQQYESKLFIDGIKVKLDSSKLLTFTKHDSIICRNKDVKEVLEIMKIEFDKIGMDYQLN